MQSAAIRPSGARTRRPLVLLASVATAGALVLSSCTTPDADTGGEVAGELTVWDWQYDAPGVGDALKQVDEAFLALHEDVELTHIQQGFEQYDQVVATSMSSGDVADVIMLQPGEVGVLKYAEALTDLTDLVSAETRDQLVGWDQVSEGLDASAPAYGIPLGTQTYVLYFNKQLFEEAGLDPEAPPASVEELFDAAETLKGAGITPFGGGDAEGILGVLWFNILWPAVATDADAKDLGSGELAWTDDKVVEIFETYERLHADGNFPAGVATTPLFGESPGQFTRGEVAMFLGLASTDMSYAQFNEALGEENVGVIQGLGLESGDAANYIPVGPAVAWSIPVSTENAAAALAYAEHLTSAESQKTLFELGGFLPNNVATELGDDAPAQPRQMLADWESHDTAVLAQSYWAVEVLLEVGKQLQLLATGQTTVADAAAGVQAVQERQG